MIVFPNAKINIGLYVTGRRPDGFHNIETIFFPIPLFDVLEVLEQKNTTGRQYDFTSSGISLGDCTSEQNLCVKAVKLLSNDFKLPPLRIHLHKNIPLGAGLGGGSADASSTIKAINELSQLNMNNEVMKNYASKLGSDCAFFVENKTSFATGRGEVLFPIHFNLWGYHLVIIHPGITINTADAYADVKIASPKNSLSDLMKTPVDKWRNIIANDFEESVFVKYPEIKNIKEIFYSAGAVYASMSGSGSSVYAVFDETPPEMKKIFPKHYFIWCAKL